MCLIALDYLGVSNDVDTVCINSSQYSCSFVKGLNVNLTSKCNV